MTTSCRENSQKFLEVEYLEEDYENDPMIERRVILNPYTGLLELDLLDTYQDTIQEETVTENRNKRKSKEGRKADWPESKKQEWLNFYQRYIRERDKAKHAETRATTLQDQQTCTEEFIEVNSKDDCFEQHSEPKPIDTDGENEEDGDVEYLEETATDDDGEKEDTASIELKGNDGECTDLEYLEHLAREIVACTSASARETEPKPIDTDGENEEDGDVEYLEETATDDNGAKEDTASIELKGNDGECTDLEYLEHLAREIVACTSASARETDKPNNLKTIDKDSDISDTASIEFKNDEEYTDVEYLAREIVARTSASARETDKTNNLKTFDKDSDISDKAMNELKDNEEYTDVEYLAREIVARTSASARETDKPNNLKTIDKDLDISDKAMNELKDNEEYTDVEYLAREIVARTSASARETAPDATPLLKLPPKSHVTSTSAVCPSKRGAQRVRARRLHSVPLCLSHERLRRRATAAYALQRKRIKSLNKLSKVCDNSLKLLKHSNMCPFKWPSEYFNCFCCSQQFKHMSMLRAHTETSHNYNEIRSRILSSKRLHKVDVSDLKCATCHLPMDDLNELQYHLKTHGLRVNFEKCSLVPYKLCTDFFTCQICDEVLSNKSVLQQHMKKHIKTHVCDACDRRFSSRKSLWLHKCRPIHRFKCIICNEILKSSYARRRHETDVHGLEFKRPTNRFKCNLCSQSFKHSNMRLEHVVSAHRDENSLFKCSFCSRSFMTLHWCTKHMNVVHAEEMMD